MRIEVLQRHIDEAVEACANKEVGMNCPISLAAKEAGLYNPYTTNLYVYCGHMGFFKLPDEAQEFVHHFDGFRRGRFSKPEPIAFELVPVVPVPV